MIVKAMSKSTRLAIHRQATPDSLSIQFPIANKFILQPNHSIFDSQESPRSLFYPVFTTSQQPLQCKYKECGSYDSDRSIECCIALYKPSETQSILRKRDNLYNERNLVFTKPDQATLTTYT